MSPTNSSGPTDFPLRVRDIVLVTILAGLLIVIIGVTSYFRLSSEASILRESAMAGVEGTWSKKIALNVGFLTTGVVRAGSHLFKLAPEPRAAFDSIRGAEVGIYKLQGTAGWVDSGAILARADKAMSARRWDRVVAVSHENELVAVYVPRRGLSSERLRCCVLVLEGGNLIVAGASGNLEPLLQIAGKHVDFGQVGQHFAIR
jgi:hypothetical protein